MSGEALTILTVRAALVLYVAALLAWTVGTQRGRWERATRLLWTAGVLLYLAHVAAAFHFVHGWSHGRALAETARQTRELFGVASGSGLWLNYLFTVVWAADALWWWIDPPGHRRRPRWMSVAVHAFLAFMFFNGAVVFASGFARWFGLAATAALTVLWLRCRSGLRPRWAR